MELIAIYKWTAIVAGGIFLIQFLASLFGLMDDVDTASDFEGGSADVGFGHALLSFISVRNITVFLLAFASTGYYTVRDYGLGGMSVIPGLFAGCAFVLFNMYLMRALASLKRDTSVTEDELVGLTAMVIFPVLPERSGHGKINVTVDGKIMTLQAITDEKEQLNKNQEVVIEKVLEGWIVLVRKQ